MKDAAKFIMEWAFVAAIVIVLLSSSLAFALWVLP